MRVRSVMGSSELAAASTIQPGFSTVLDSGLTSYLMGRSCLLLPAAFPQKFRPSNAHLRPRIAPDQPSTVLYLLYNRHETKQKTAKKQNIEKETKTDEKTRRPQRGKDNLMIHTQGQRI